MTGDRGILLVRPDHLGDVLLTLPAVAALRQLLPRRRITYLTPAGVSDVPRHSPIVDEIETLEFPEPTAPADPPGWSAVVTEASRRFEERFEVAILFRPRDPWSGALVARARIPVRVGFDHPETRPFLTHTLPVPTRRHVAVMGLDLVELGAECLGARVPPTRAPLHAEFRTTHDEEREAEEALRDVASVGSSPIVLHPGSGWRLKNWPALRWGLLASALERRHGVPPLLVSGPGEEELAASVVTASGWQAERLPRVLSLGGLAALHGRARVVVATDSGPLHLAAMVGAPVVGLYGPFGPDLFAPLSPSDRSRTVSVDLPCSPCGTLVTPPCGAVTEPACVTGIGVERVAAAVSELIAAAGPAD